MAPKNPASLVESSFHSPALLELVSREPNPSVYAYVANKVVEVVRRALQSYPHSYSFIFPDSEEFHLFVANVFTASYDSGVGMNVIVTALVFMHRVDDVALHDFIKRKSELHPCHFIFVSAVMTAIKCLADNPPKLKHHRHWTSHLISRTQLRVYEIAFLGLLGYQVKVSETELLQYYHDIQACYVPQPSPDVENAPATHWEQSAAPLAFPSWSQPAPADHKQQVWQKPRNYSSGTSPYQTQGPFPQYVDSTIEDHHSAQQSRTHSTLAPTPYPPTNLHSEPILVVSYTTPSSTTIQHVDPSNSVHRSTKRSRAPSTRSFTPYHSSSKLHSEYVRAASYVTSSSTAFQHVDPSNIIYQSTEQFRTSSVRAPTPYQASYHSYPESVGAAIYPTPNSTTVVVPVIPPDHLRRSRSQATFPSKEFKQTGSSLSLWNKIISK